MGKVSREQLTQELRDSSTNASVLADHVKHAEKLSNDDLTLFITIHPDKAEVLEEFLSSDRIKKNRGPYLDKTDTLGHTPLQCALTHKRHDYLPIITKACRENRIQDYWQKLDANGNTSLHLLLMTSKRIGLDEFITHELQYMGKAMLTVGADGKTPCKALTENANSSNIFFSAISGEEENNLFQIIVAELTPDANIIELFPLFRLEPAFFQKIVSHQNAEGDTVTHQFARLNNSALNKYMISNLEKFMPHLGVPNQNGETPIHAALDEENETLMEHFTSVNSEFEPIVNFCEEVYNGENSLVKLLKRIAEAEAEKITYVERSLRRLARTAPCEMFQAEKPDSGSAGFLGGFFTPARSTTSRNTDPFPSLSPIIVEAAQGLTQRKYLQTLCQTISSENQTTKAEIEKLRTTHSQQSAVVKNGTSPTPTAISADDANTSTQKTASTLGTATDRAAPTSPVASAQIVDRDLGPIAIYAKPEFLAGTTFGLCVALAGLAIYTATKNQNFPSLKLS